MPKHTEIHERRKSHLTPQLWDVGDVKARTRNEIYLLFPELCL
ncbi:hypothetical protein IFVP203_C2120181 [Vibrio parahaemolyticus]